MAKKKLKAKAKSKTSGRAKAKPSAAHSRAKRAVTKHAASPAALQYIPWHTVPLEDLNPLLQRQYVVGQEIMVARVLLKKGCIVPEHSHHN
jgi:quercetin dioxygenase-like cupin family protein